MRAQAKPEAPPAGALLDIRGLTLDQVTRHVYAFALREHGTRRKAAAALGVPRSTFCERANAFGLGLGGADDGVA